MPFNPAKAKLAYQLTFEGSWPTAVAFLGTNRLAAANQLGHIFVWDLPEKAPTFKVEPKSDRKAPNVWPRRKLDGHTNEVTRLVVTPDGKQLISSSLDRTIRIAFGLTEPAHGSDATHMETRAVAEARNGVDGWRLDGEKMWTTGMHTATHVVVFSRTSGAPGDARGISAFLVPADAEGVKVEEYLWTFNMPTDHPRVSFRNVWVPADALFGLVDGHAGDTVEQPGCRQAGDTGADDGDPHPSLPMRAKAARARRRASAWSTTGRG